LALIHEDYLVVHDFKCCRADISRLASVGAAACVAVFAAACSGDGQAASASTVAATRSVAPVAEVPAGVARQAAAPVASGPAAQQSDAQARGSQAGLIAHPENIQLGLYVNRAQLTLRNPREHDPKALEEGKNLFVSYNCADCHGDAGSGAMGPALDDGRWHFGGDAGEVYESISEGRPDGMPAWGGRIPDSQIWALVKYVRSLSAGKDPTTENFEGATIQRTGH